MKNNYKMAAGLVLLMCLAVGCSKKEPEESSIVSTEIIQDTEDMSENASEDVNQPEQESEHKVIPMKEGEESLSGPVRSIGENSVIISKIFIEEGEDGKGSIVTLPGEGDREEELVTVNFTDATEFHFWTIKSGGGDIDMRESSFSEIEVGSGLEMYGHYEGEIFMASRVIIEVYE